MPYHIMDFDTVGFILEVKKRPALWDRRCTDYADRFVKMKCWEEIIDIYSKKNDTPREKRELGKILSKKWRNIKDNFVKASKNSNGSLSKQKSPYTYYKDLLFLRNSISSNESGSGSNYANDNFENEDTYETSQNVTHTNKRNKNEDDDDSQTYDAYETLQNIVKRSKISKNENDTHNASQYYDGPYETPQSTANPKRNETSKNEDGIGQQLISFLNNNFQRKTDNENDDDRLFLLSLLTEFKKIPEPNKLDARCEIIKAIKNAQQPAVCSNTNPQWDRGYRGQQVYGSEYAGSDASNAEFTVKVESQ